MKIILNHEYLGSCTWFWNLKMLCLCFRQTLDTSANQGIQQIMVKQEWTLYSDRPSPYHKLFRCSRATLYQSGVILALFSTRKILQTELNLNFDIMFLMIFNGVQYVNWIYAKLHISLKTTFNLNPFTMTLFNNTSKNPTL